MPTEPISAAHSVINSTKLQALKLFDNNLHIISTAELIDIKLGTCIMPTESISAAHSVIDGTNITGSQIIR
jgi:hypothetical protein